MSKITFYQPYDSGVTGYYAVLFSEQQSGDTPTRGYIWSGTAWVSNPASAPTVIAAVQLHTTINGNAWEITLPTGDADFCPGDELLFSIIIKKGVSWVASEEFVAGQTFHYRKSGNRLMPLAGGSPAHIQAAIGMASANMDIQFGVTQYVGGIWVDTVNGTTGTVFGVNGTPSNPCKTFAAARTIAQANGFATFFIKGGSNIITGDDFPNARFIGIDAGSRINLQNKDFGGAYFEGLILYGTLKSGSERIQCVKCRLGDTGQALTGLVISAMDCLIAGDLTLVENEDHYFLHCGSGVAGTGTPSITFGGTGSTNVNIRNYSGGMEIRSMSANHTMSYEAVGQLVLNASCTGGTIARRGAHNLVDNAGGAVTLVELAAVDREGVAIGVWDRVISRTLHNVPQSAGKILRESGADILLTGISPNTGGTTNDSGHIELDSTASSDTGAYDPGVVSIVDGTGAGQSRQILQYDGATKIAHINRDWRVVPDDTSEYIITSSAGDTHINEGVLQGPGPSTNTAQLNIDASGVDNTYLRQLLFIVAGPGADQVRTIEAYDGLSRVATLSSDWDTPVTAESNYIMIPTQAVSAALTIEAWKNSTGWTEGGTWTFETVIKIIAAWAMGLARDRSGVPDTIERLDAEDQTTPIFDETLSETTPYRETDLRI
jgi:hypothetical protein